LHGEFARPGRHVCRLFDSSSSGLRARAKAAAQDILSDGHKTLTLGLDNLSNVGDSAVAAVIVALRTMRDSGGTIQLRARKTEHRRQLRLNGLDRIVTVVPEF
jgi:anti-anti-sigma regulatory factor